MFYLLLLDEKLIFAKIRSVFDNVTLIYENQF